jgi:hypothetical protein
VAGKLRDRRHDRQHDPQPPGAAAGDAGEASDGRETIA